MSQAQLQRANVVTPSASPPAQPDPFGAGSDEPQYTMSATAAATGQKSTGIMFMVAASTASKVTLWKRDPHTKLWGVVAVFDATSTPAFAPFQWVTICNLLASELWWETDAANDGPSIGPAVLVEELSG